MKRTLCFLSAIFWIVNIQSGWSQENQGSSCNSITGLYQVVGEYLSDSSQYARARMDWALFLREAKSKLAGIELVWNNTDSVLTMNMVGENLSSTESYLVHASCMNGKVAYEIEHNGYSEGGAKNWAYLKAQLSKDATGNLILSGRIRVESTELLIFKSTQESEINARFFPVLKEVR